MVKDIAMGVILGLTGFAILWGLIILGLVTVLYRLGKREKEMNLE